MESVSWLLSKPGTRSRSYHFVIDTNSTGRYDVYVTHGRSALSLAEYDVLEFDIESSARTYREALDKTCDWMSPRITNGWVVVDGVLLEGDERDCRNLGIDRLDVLRGRWTLKGWSVKRAAEWIEAGWTSRADADRWYDSEWFKKGTLTLQQMLELHNVPVGPSSYRKWYDGGFGVEDLVRGGWLDLTLEQAILARRNGFACAADVEPWMAAGWIHSRWADAGEFAAAARWYRQGVPPEWATEYVRSQSA